MGTTTRLWTRKELEQLPDDGRRYEIIDGMLYVNGVLAPGGDPNALRPEVTPSPSWRHQDAVSELAHRLRVYLAERGLGHLIFAPADVPLSESVAVQPDLFVVPLAGDRPPIDWSEAGRLLLAIEVLSPSTANTDKGRKRRAYQRAGVPEYWIVDLDSQVVERWRPDDTRPEILDARLEWQPSSDAPPLVIDLGQFFAGLERR